ncbi:putative E3 ubiquitin-protein ligase XBOS33 isoform X1 [Carex littledalei]|uniref:RING-type E3 ubiquitin transferase n=1 Tax=Carex littledalei TaxID=544730 RepID=A0A833R2K8_9POAL|nr:putative E3 ubiquitin-protein ligase XBOS33 isoform X1 [Carex littledalei]
MGNSMISCVGYGEQLVTAAREGDVAEVQKLLQINPGLARYSTFCLLNSPLHLASARGHHEVVALLLESGADPNSRNIYGQTPLMQACRIGHWQVVQRLLVFRSNVDKVEGLGNKTALHFAAAGGHVRCIRLLVANFGSAASNGVSISSKKEATNTDHNSELCNFINKPAAGGVTALHMAAMNSHYECVHLLLDLNANVSAQTLSYASSSMGSIGVGSTPLHYAASGGNVKCCQASSLSVLCWWLPVDVAMLWGCHWLEQILSPRSVIMIPRFPPSRYLCLPLSSILDIARECGMQLSSSCEEIDEDHICAVCLDRFCDVAAQGCKHELCVRCALNLCTTMGADEASNPPGRIPCPLCRASIQTFIKSPSFQPKKPDLNHSLSSGSEKPLVACRSEYRRNSSSVVPSEVVASIPCTSISSSAVVS